MGLGDVNPENATNSKNPETAEKIQEKSSNHPNNAKQSGKSTAPLKEIVSSSPRVFYV